MKKIYVTKPFLPPIDEYVEYLEKIWEKKILTNNGPLNSEFESKLAEYLGVKYISLVNNATTGLMIALEALSLKNEIITTPFSFIATSHSIKWNRLKPVFVDTDKLTGNLLPENVEEAVTNKTSGILATHNFGIPSNLNRMKILSEKYKIPLIYDAAPAIGVKINGDSILKFGDISVLSFHATKIFNTFEGGAIICKTKELKERVDKIRNFGITDEETVDCLGLNGKMSELNAAMGILQLKYINKVIMERKNIYERYREGINTSDKIQMIEIKKNIEYNYSYFPILFGGKEIRDKIYILLKENNIYCRKYWYPLITEHETYHEKDIYKRLENAKDISNKILNIPLYPDLKKKDVELVISTINKAFI